MPDGLSVVLGNLDRLGKSITSEAIEAALETGEEVLETAQRNCPVKTGRLRGSGYVEVKGNVVEIGFSETYAANIHEDTSAQYSNGEAKFLEVPFKSVERTLPEKIARKARL